MSSNPLSFQKWVNKRVKKWVKKWVKTAEYNAWLLEQKRVTKDLRKALDRYQKFHSKEFKGSLYEEAIKDAENL